MGRKVVGEEEGGWVKRKVDGRRGRWMGKEEGGWVGRKVDGC